MALLLSSISQGLLWAIMAIGVYLTFRILNVADLTVEGSPFGGCLQYQPDREGCGFLVVCSNRFAWRDGSRYRLGISIYKMEIPALLSGIIKMTGLYSINLHIMGQGPISLYLVKGP